MPLSLLLPCALAACLHVASAAWSWPLAAPHSVVRGFAPPPHDWLPGHRGVDLAAVVGEPVLAAGSGRVSFAGSVAGTPVVAIRHPDGLETTYEPVSAAVRTGEQVHRGQVLGAVAGRLAHCAEVCLHWGLRRGADYLDPLALVGAERVRLLPLPEERAGPSVLPMVMLPAATAAVAASGWSKRRRRKRGFIVPRRARSAR